MRFADLLAFSWRVISGYRGRTFLILLAMGIGVAAVVAVTALGEGARLYVVNQFGSLGTHLVIVLPGRSETAGAMPGVLIGKTPRGDDEAQVHVDAQHDRQDQHDHGEQYHYGNRPKWLDGIDPRQREQYAECR